MVMKKISIFLIMSGTTLFFSSNANKKYIEQFLPKDPVILEAGAHIGTDTMQMATMWPTSTIHAFEPVPKLYDQLIKSTQQLPNVYCYQLALSNVSGSAKFYVSGGTSDASSSLLKPKEHLFYHPQVTFEEVIEVKTLTLDEWAEKNGVDHIDFMWLDMQGYELTMLKSSPKILSTVSVIFLEVSRSEFYHGTSLFNEVHPWLVGQGFQYICEIFENALYVRKK